MHWRRVSGYEIVFRQKVEEELLALTLKQWSLLLTQYLYIHETWIKPFGEEGGHDSNLSRPDRREIRFDGRSADDRRHAHTLIMCDLSDQIASDEPPSTNGREMERMKGDGTRRWTDSFASQALIRFRHVVLFQLSAARVRRRFKAQTGWLYSWKRLGQVVDQKVIGPLDKITFWFLGIKRWWSWTGNVFKIHLMGFPIAN